MANDPQIQEIASKPLEYDEKRTSTSHTSVEYATHQGTAAPTTLPSLQVLMQYAEVARAREAGLGPGETFVSPPTDSKSVDGVTSGPPDIDEDLINARRALRTASWFAVFYLITTDILGPFNAPFAFSQVGYVPGVILYLIMGGVACYTGLILWKLFCALDSEHYPVRTYADLGERIFGTWFKNLCTVLQSLQLIINVGTICLSNAQSVAQIAVHNEFCFSVQILIWSLFGMIIGQIRSLKNYGWFANMAVWLNLLTIFITMGVVAHSPPNFAGATAAYGIAPTDPISKTAFTHLPLFSKVNGIMNMVFAYGGAMIFPEFMAEMRRPMDFWKAMCCAQLLIGIVYMMFGLFVYSFQGQFTLPLAYQGMSSFAWQTVGNALALVTGIIAAGLYGNIGIKVAYYQIVEQWFKGPPLMSKKGWYIWSAMVLLYWSLAFIVASAIPQVQTISGLVAAVCIMQFTYTFPPLLYAGFYLRLDAARDERGDTWWSWSRWARGMKSSPNADVVVVSRGQVVAPRGGGGGGGCGGVGIFGGCGIGIFGGGGGIGIFGGGKGRSEKPTVDGGETTHAKSPRIAGIAQGSTWYYKTFNIVLFLASLAMACLGMYGSGKSIQETFKSGGAATSFGCTAPV
ncbi:transmembrane amino acid transporter protein-domain-containing protein [Irpex rosettiformis]|uniref:Transmembrane amino acid transporter protein-domain-containing protein n=1 Tax=Irpex rosettiformis TaxID=378272 RepID=A0ACB8UIM5_9APHY|nr:transmembrane amino acid transporter protein-domain-containing protein [Irpex rosettiformis]